MTHRAARAVPGVDRPAWRACAVAGGLLLLLINLPPAQSAAPRPPLAQALGAALDRADRSAFLALLSVQAVADPMRAAAVAAALAPWLGAEIATRVLLALPPEQRIRRAPAVLVAVLLATRGTEAERVGRAVLRAAPGCDAAMVERIVRRVQAAAGDAEALRLLVFEDLDDSAADREALAAGSAAAAGGEAEVRAWLSLPPAEGTPGDGLAGAPATGGRYGLSGEEGEGWTAPPADPRPEQLLARPSPS